MDLIGRVLRAIVDVTGAITGALEQGADYVGDVIVGSFSKVVEIVFEELIGRLIGFIYGVFFTMSSFMTQFVSSALVETGDTLRSCGGGFSATCFGEPYFQQAYIGSLRVGAVLCFVAVCVGVTATIFNRLSEREGDAGMMRVLLGLPKLALLWAMIVGMTAFSVAMFDGLAFWWADYAAGSGAGGSRIEDINDMVFNITGQVGGLGPTPSVQQSIDSAAVVIPFMGTLAFAKLFVVMFIQLLMMIAMFIIGIVLMVRAVLVHVVVILAPMVSVMLMTRWASAMQSLMTKLVGLILIKPVIVIVLALGSATIGGGSRGNIMEPSVVLGAVLDNGFGDLLNLMGSFVVGLSTLFIAGLSPMMVMGLVDSVGRSSEGAIGSGQAARPGRVGSKAMQYGYYAKSMGASRVVGGGRRMGSSLRGLRGR